MGLMILFYKVLGVRYTEMYIIVRSFVVRSYRSSYKKSEAEHAHNEHAQKIKCTVIHQVCAHNI